MTSNNQHKSDKENRRYRKTLKDGEHQVELKKPSAVIPSRVRVLFFVIFVLFLILVARLFNMQVQNKNFYSEMLLKTGSETKVVEEAPRGQIFDASGKVLAATQMTQAVTFTRNESITSSQMLANAKKLVPIIGNLVDTSGLTIRDKKDFYLADPSHLAQVAKELTEKEKVDSSGNDLSSSQIYIEEVAKVTDAQINYSANDLVMVELYKEMNGTTNFATSNIVTGSISAEQEAEIGEAETSMPGISFGNTWTMNKDESSLLAPLIGTVSSSKSGLPAEQAKQYLAKGYQLNDRVGTSYLEQEFESELQGKQSITQVAVNSSGGKKGETVLQKGTPGNNLKLTVNSNFENAVQKILKADYQQYVLDDGFGGYGQGKGIYAVVLNAKTGAVLAMNGLDYDEKTGQETDNALATLTDAFAPGSTVKPATVTAAWANNIISGNATLNDQNIQFGDSNPISSWFTNGVIPTNVVEALTLSSNTYMVQLALSMLGTPYTPGMSLSDTNRVKVYNELRKIYGEYGLGVSTGIDLPNESTGLVKSTKDSSATMASLLYESFGQYDTYTPMQLAQYAATLANNGTRVAPHIVEGVYANSNGVGGGSLGKLLKTIPTKTLNQVNVSQENMSILHDGMAGCVSGSWLGNNGTGYYIGKGANTTIYAKDGQAQVYVGNVQTTDDNVVAFAPGPNPQIAVAVMTPQTLVKDGNVADEVSEYTTRDIINEYQKEFGLN